VRDKALRQTLLASNNSVGTTLLRVGRAKRIERKKPTRLMRALSIRDHVLSLIREWGALHRVPVDYTCF
jgi:hypothetical protein